MGKSKKKCKNVVISFRLEPTEKCLMEYFADFHGLDLATFIRLLCRQVIYSPGRNWFKPLIGVGGSEHEEISRAEDLEAAKTPAEKRKIRAEIKAAVGKRYDECRENLLEIRFTRLLDIDCRREQLIKDGWLDENEGDE